MNLNHIRVKRRLPAAMLALLTMALMLAAGMQWHVSALEARLARQLRASDQRIELALQWQGLIRLSIERVLMASSANDASFGQFLEQRLQADRGTIDALQRQLSASVGGLPEQARLEQVAEHRIRVLRLQAEVLRDNENKSLQTLSQAAQAQERVDQQYLPAIQAYRDALDGFVQALRARRDALVIEVEDQRRVALWTGAGFALAVLAAGILLSIGLIRSIILPLQRAVSLSDAMAGGDLTVDARDERRDEFGQLLGSMSVMAARLRSVVREVRSGVEAVADTATDIVDGKHELCARTEQALASLQQTAASMEQLTHAVSQSADTAQRAKQLALSVAEAAAEGGQVVGQAVSSMDQIRDSSRRIGDIIGVIDGLAFQTNILALNAAVEAARAGEQGRGFAIVAREVRELAQRSAAAAHEIRQLIQASVESVAAGSRQIGTAGQSMGRIVEGVYQVSTLITAISAASAEQHAGIGQVNQAMGQLDRMTQANARLVEQSSAAASALGEQSRRLSAEVAVFAL